jgi:elongation factor P hydroxylase
VRVCKGPGQVTKVCSWYCLSLRQRWEDNIEMDVEVSPQNVDWTRLVQDWVL